MIRIPSGSHTSNPRDVVAAFETNQIAVLIMSRAKCLSVRGVSPLFGAANFD
jgi:hypothetical protein